MPRSTRRARRELPIAVAAAGGLAPLNAMDGNNRRASDVCLPWNANVAARKTG